MEVVFMAKKYEYHKQNEYPGERVAEKKRVADREAEYDKRTDVHDAEIKRSTNRAARINRQRDTADTIGLIIIGGLVVLLLFGGFWGIMSLQKQSKEVDNLNTQLDKAQAANYELTIANKEICGTTDTNPPTILYMSPLTSVSPANNEMNVSVRVPITVMFSEDMNPLTINKETFTVEQRTTPATGSATDQYRTLPIEGTVTYSNRKATFTSTERFYPNQIYGNVFTVTITTGVEDVAGNSLMNDYIWSFTTGGQPFNIGGTTSQTN
jgi:hypothetical protein